MSWLFLFYFLLLLEPPILMPFGVVAEARGEGRAGGGGGVICDTLACVLRASEPAAVVFGKALSGGGNTAYATGLRHWSVTTESTKRPRSSDCVCS